MAYQHFYSRVPAKVSMYNRSDSFDTFAHSEGLEREFIERELSVVYQNKLNKGDLDAVRRGEIPRVYSQCVLKSGKVVQGCTTYLSLDYTGERSAYFTHSLVLTEDEKRNIFYSKEHFCFNPDMFNTDIEDFDITSATAAPNVSYPAVEYIAKEGNPSNITDKYPEEAVKAFIYAVLSAIKGKGKNVYFRLHCPNLELSDAALEFINKIMAVIPYDMRDSLSFVTYVTDYAQYPSHKLKCVSDFCGEYHSTRSVFIDMQTGLVTGITEDELASARTLMNFFYMLLDNRDLREEFLSYMENAAKVMPTLAIPTTKVLSELVFLFCAVCGKFSEESILPNDARVYEHFCIFDKYREILCEDYRNTAYKCLARYPKSHEAIPKNIFAKLVRLYSGEYKSAKRVAMNSVLELIHTDIMREKLFSFIRSNYENEDDEIKFMVNSDLCRVFYGGFLQQQILEFFSVNFKNTPTETQNLILDKIFLSIRTTAIQPKVLEFISTHYGDMTDEQKARFYDTFVEMLPECDALAEALCKLVDEKIPSESDKLRADVASRMADAVEADYRKREHKLMPILASGSGFCREQVIKLALGVWSGRKIYVEYIALLSAKKIEQKTEEVAFILGTQKFSTDAKRKLLDVLSDVYSENVAKLSLYDWLDADLVFAKAIDGELLKTVRNKVLYPSIREKLYDVFNADLGSSGMQRAEIYCKQNKALVDSDGYNAICTFNRLVAALDKKLADKVIAEVIELDRLGVSQGSLASYVRAFVYDKNFADAERNMLCEICVGFILKKSSASEVYTSYKKIYAQKYLMAHGAKAEPKKADAEGARVALKTLWKFLSQIAIQSNDSAKRVSDCTEDIKKAFATFSADCGKGADKWIEQNIQPRPECLADCFVSEQIKAKNQGAGFLSKLFGKK